MAQQKHPFKKIPERTVPWGGVHTPDPLRQPSHPHASFPGDHQNMFADGGLIPDGEMALANGGEIPDHELTPHAKRMSLGRRLAKRSRTRSPGHFEGSHQDNLQRRIAGEAAARELMGATMQKNRQRRKR